MFLKTLYLLFFIATVRADYLQNIEQDFTRLHQSVAKFRESVNDDDMYVYSNKEREAIIDITLNYLHESSILNESNGVTSLKRIWALTPNSYEHVLKNLNKLIYMSEYVSMSMSIGDAFIAVVGEDFDKLSYRGDYFRKILYYVIKNAKISQQYQNKHKKSGNSLTIFDLASFNQQQLEKIFKISSKEAIDLRWKIEYFLKNAEEIIYGRDSVNERAGSYSVFYYAKVLFLKLASYFALPGIHKIGLDDLKLHTQEMNPGDIGVIQRYYKLSNFVFNGNWTHSLLYLGTYSKFEEYFSHDAKTNDFYERKCLAERLNCNDFLSYMSLVYRKNFERYKKSSNDKNPIVTIEALKPGVILNRMKQSMAWDNLAVFRPNLSIFEKAVAVDRAFSILGTPYDYDFNGYTNGKFVCTEVISYIYEEDSSLEVNGLKWKMSKVFNSPVMYAFDIVKTYFSSLNSGSKYLELVLFLKSTKKSDGAILSTREELAETI